METKETSAKCCGFSGKRKKIIIATIAIVLMGVAALIVVIGAKWKIRQAANRGNFAYGRSANFVPGQMMNRNSGDCPMLASKNTDTQFVLPGDAAKSGEIALVVDDLGITQKTIASLATKNGGMVYATTISYASEKLKNGSIVVQIPVDKFDAAFGLLKTIGSKVVQESTRQIAPRSSYQMPLAEVQGPEEKVVDLESSIDTDEEEDISNIKDKALLSGQPEVVSPTPAIYPAYAQPLQDKGYIRVVFVDYGKKSEREKFAGIAASAGQSMQRIWIGLGLKLLILLVLLVFLWKIMKRLLHDFKAMRASRKINKNPQVHVVRQMSKPRQRIVRIAKKK